MGDVHIVVGGQFGSEGKGHFTAQLLDHLVKTGGDPAVVRTGGPNAGHTVYDENGQEWKLRCIPVGAVVDPQIPLVLAQGGEVDLDVLQTEVDLLQYHGFKIEDRLHVDAQATLIESKHSRDESRPMAGESLIHRIGSTGKGIGAARADRIMRTARLVGGHENTTEFLLRHLRGGGSVVVEATQGYGLGLHAGYYPFCTSRNVRGIDVLAETGLSPWVIGVDRVITWVVFRPNPIRVAGNSGPLLDETTWDELNLKEEFTTVTQKMRRVGAWDSDLAHAAMTANGSPSDGMVRPVLMFADYVDIGVGGLTDCTEFDKESWGMFFPFEQDLDCQIWAYGTGPHTLAWRYEF